MSQRDDFNHKFKRAVTSNFNVSGEDTDRLEAQCGLFGWLTKRLLILVPPLQERSILDVGCGTGISTRVILDSVENNVSIFGVDISRGMIEKAEARCPEAVFRLGDAELLSHIFSEPFGGVYYTACIFLMPNARKSLTEASKIMASGASIAASFMETLEGEEGENIIASASESHPDLAVKHRKLFPFEELYKEFKRLFRNVVNEDVRFKMNRKDAEAFFSIPAQSASLFPGQPLQTRLNKVEELFQILGREEYFLHWRLVGGYK